MSPNPRISVLLATFNRAELLSRTLPSLLRQDLPPEDYEVIVVNDGSNDGTAAYLLSLSTDRRIKIIRTENLGQGCAYNRALELADGEYVLFLDDDIVCPPALLSAHLHAHEPGGKLAISGPLFLSADSPESVACDAVREVESHFEIKPARRVRRPWPGDAKIDANTSVSTSALRELGGIAPEFTRARFDLYLGLCLARAGFRFLYCGGASAEQVYIKTPFDVLTGEVAAYGRAEFELCGRFPEFRHASHFAAATSGGFWRRLVKRVVLGSPYWPTGMIARTIGWSDRFRSNRFLRRRNLQFYEAARSLHTIRAGKKSCGSKKTWHSGFALTVPVLLYHHVGPRQPGTFPTLTVLPEEFSRHLRWLKQAGYHGISAAQWNDWYWRGRPLPEKPVVLTFDDGYKDLAIHAFPRLVESGFGATVFIVTSQIGGSNLWDQRSGSGTHALLDENDIRSWSNQAIDFGSHAHTHADLTTLGPAELHDELLISRDLLSKIIGKDVRSFAYPYGATNLIVREAVRSMYRSAFTTDVGINSLATDCVSLRRSMVKPNDTRVDILARAALGWNPIEGVRMRIAKSRGRI